jgi:hypothetical protein
MLRCSYVIYNLLMTLTWLLKVAHPPLSPFLILRIRSLLLVTFDRPICSLLHIYLFIHSFIHLFVYFFTDLLQYYDVSAPNNDDPPGRIWELALSATTLLSWHRGFKPSVLCGLSLRMNANLWHVFKGMPHPLSTVSCAFRFLWGHVLIGVLSFGGLSGSLRGTGLHSLSGPIGR